MEKASYAKATCPCLGKPHDFNIFLLLLALLSKSFSAMRFKFVLLLASICAIPAQSTGTHIVGGEIYYTCLGNNNYEISFRMYRDCYNGIPPFDDPGVLYIYTGNGVLYDSLTASPTVTLIPVVVNAPCLGAPPYVCVERGQYSYLATLPPNPLGYYLTYQRCCRNQTIINLVNPGSQGSTYWQEIPSSNLVTCNSSPSFNSYPPVAICAGVPLVYDHSAFDPDGDSLVYELCPPYLGGSQGDPLPKPAAPPPYPNVVYSGGYSGAYPITSNPALSIDPATGLLTGTPTQIGQYVVGVCVKEYRNGVFIENHYRDFQFNVVQCTPTVIASTPNVNQCDDPKVFFWNNSTGANTYWWDFGDPNITADTSVFYFPNYTYPGPGTYTVTLIVNKGQLCSDTTTATVTILDPWVTEDFTFNTPCLGSPMQFTDLSQVSTGSIVNWHWQFGDGTTSTQKNPSHVYAGIGPYTVTLNITTSDGCKSTIVKTVNLHPAPAPSFTALAVCPGTPMNFLNTTTISSGSITSWQWNFGDGTGSSTQQDPSYTYQNSGTYLVTLTATSSFGCVKTIAQTVNVHPRPSANAGPDQSFCVGGSAVLSASGGSSYAWSPGAGLSNSTAQNPIASPGTTTTYTLTVVNSYGCTDTDIAKVTVNPLPVANAGPDKSVCTGGAAYLGAGGGSTYQWTPSTFLNNPSIWNPIATPPVNMTYTVTVTDANGCKDDDAVSVTLLPLPVADAGPDGATCPGLSTQLQGSGGISYVWSPAAGLSSTTIFDPLAAPTSTIAYTLTVTDANGCKDDDVVKVTIHPQPLVSAGPDQSYCIGGSAQLTGSGGLTYSWSPSTGLSNATVSNPIASPTSTTTYVLTVTDANGCEGTDYAQVKVNPLPVANAGPDDAFCIGSGVQLNGSGGVQYTWTPAAGLSATNIANPLASPTASCTYILTVTDANGCEDTDDVQIVVNPLPIADAGPDDAFCIGGSSQLGGSGGWSYVWAPATGLSATNIWNPVASPSSTTTYVLTVTDSNGCTDSDAVEIIVNPLPHVDAGPDQPLCTGSTVQLSASGGVLYSWTPTSWLSNPNTANPIAAPPNTVSYTVTCTDANGCTNDDDLVITVHPLPVADAGPPRDMCPGESVELQGAGGVSYSWSPPTWLSNAAIADPISSPVSSISYMLTVTDANGCRDDDLTTVTVHPAAIADAGPDTIIYPGASAVLRGSGNGTYHWWPAATLSNPTIANPVASPSELTEYFLEVTTVNGCTRSDSVIVGILGLWEFNMPTAFSPNGDGLNDLYMPVNVENFTLSRFVIFNRWGQRVFETNDISQGWDGTWNGVEQEIASYAFIVYGHGSRNEPVRVQGNVTLVR